jgi:para-aminobenzoate synthetase / 4-amino-4-deoxychorismate lyase
MRLRLAAGFNPSLLFENPHHIWAPSTFGEALNALRAAQAALNDGYWIAGAVSYEFGAQLHGVYSRTYDPLLVLGAFSRPSTVNWNNAPPKFLSSAPLSRISLPQYATAIDWIVGRIRDGEVYQVNYTVPFDLGFSGEPFSLFRFLAAQARAPYSAYLEYGDLALVSISPELFVRFEGDVLTTKPMKGTSAPGNVDALATPKNRAEHVMIVDLLRNDFQRICEGVEVLKLFQVERYPTFATMTSTISGRLRSNTSLEQFFRAAFPCGSVTGAPKRAAIEHIGQIEHHARGFYTGTIGFLSPQRRGWWNVPIRTLQIDRRHDRARFDAGGGIVTDSNADDEWNEILTKSRFLRPAFEHFALWETFRCGPDASDVQAHLDRLRASSFAFGLNSQNDCISRRLAEYEHVQQVYLVRLRVGFSGVHVDAELLQQAQPPVDVCMSSHRVHSADPLLRHKSSWRPIHEAAAREARERGCFDAILRNERGEVTEGARTNVFARKGNTLYTPPLHCGVLPGILRSRLVTEGKAVEQILTEADLVAADAIYAGNSARGLLPARIT